MKAAIERLVDAVETKGKRVESLVILTTSSNSLVKLGCTKGNPSNVAKRANRCRKVHQPLVRGVEVIACKNARTVADKLLELFPDKDLRSKEIYVSLKEFKAVLESF